MFSIGNKMIINKKKYSKLNNCRYSNKNTNATLDYCKDLTPDVTFQNNN